MIKYPPLKPIYTTSHEPVTHARVYVVGEWFSVFLLNAFNVTSCVSNGPHGFRGDAFTHRYTSYSLANTRQVVITTVTTGLFKPMYDETHVNGTVPQTAACTHS